MKTLGPVTRSEPIFIVISTVTQKYPEIFKLDITAAYLNTPMNDNVKHKSLMLDEDVAAVLMSMDANHCGLDKIIHGFKETTYWWNKHWSRLS